MSLTKEAIQHIQDTAAYSEISSDVGAFGAREPVMLVPESYQAISLEKYMPHRSSYRFAYQTDSLDDFVIYCRGHSRDDGGAACFVDGDNMTAKTIFDIGTYDAPLHQEHTATVKLVPTAVYKFFRLSMLDSKHDQRTAAELLIDWADYIECTGRDGEKMQVFAAAEAIRSMTVESAKKVNSVVGDFSGAMDTMERIEADKEKRLPQLIEICCAPYLGFDATRLPVRVSVFPQGDQPPRIGFRAIAIEQAVEQIKLEFVQKLKTKLYGMSVLQGIAG